MRRDVVHTDQNETGLYPGDIQRQHARGRYSVRTSCVDHCIPQRLGVLGIHPDLVSKVSCIPGA